MASPGSPSVDLHWRCAVRHTQVHAVIQLDMRYAFISIGTQREGLSIRCFPLLYTQSSNASFDQQDSAHLEQVQVTTSHHANNNQFHGSAVPRVLVHRGFDATVLYVSLGPLDRCLTDAPSSTYCSRPVRGFSVRSLLRRAIRVRGLDPQWSNMTLRPPNLMPSKHHYSTAVISMCFLLMGSASFAT